MSIDLVAFGWMFSLTTPYAVGLCVFLGVADCVCPISSNVLINGTAYFEMMKIALNLDLAADEMTDFTISEILRTAQLLGGKLAFIERK